MSDPIVHIKTDGIANSDYPIKEIPFNVTKATIHLDYSSRAPVTVILHGSGDIAAECAAGVRKIIIDGKVYRLVVDEIETAILQACSTPDVLEDKSLLPKAITKFDGTEWIEK